MPLEIRVRELSPTDSIAELTTLIHRGYAALGRRGFNFPGVDQTAETTAARASHGICIVAEAQGSLIGTILLQGPFRQAPSSFLMREDVACFMQFAVDPAWQHVGIGGQLLAQAEAQAAAGDCAYLCTDTAVQAPELVAYYRRRGFESVEEMQWPGKTYRSLVLAKTLAH